MERINLNSNEKVARQIAGIESGKFFTMNESNADVVKEREHINKELDRIEEKKEEIYKQSEKLVKAKLESKLDFSKLKFSKIY